MPQGQSAWPVPDLMPALGQRRRRRRRDRTLRIVGARWVENPSSRSVCAQTDVNCCSERGQRHRSGGPAFLGAHGGHNTRRVESNTHGKSENRTRCVCRVAARPPKTIAYAIFLSGRPRRHRTLAHNASGPTSTRNLRQRVSKHAVCRAIQYPRVCHVTLATHCPRRSGGGGTRVPWSPKPSVSNQGADGDMQANNVSQVKFLSLMSRSLPACSSQPAPSALGQAGADESSDKEMRGPCALPLKKRTYLAPWTMRGGGW